MRRKRFETPTGRAVMLAASLGIAACGSGTTHPASTSTSTSTSTSVSDSGSGSGTLYAGVELTFSTIGTNPASPSLSVVLAQVARGGAPVSGATIELVATDGTALSPAESASTPGSYQTSNFTWQPGWHLAITSASGHLEASIDAPGKTTITTPAMNATVSAGPIEFQWSDAWAKKAQSAWVSPCCGLSTVKLTDTGSGSVQTMAPGGVFTLYRQDVTSLAGGVANSFASATTSNGVLLTVE